MDATIHARTVSVMIAGSLIRLSVMSWGIPAPAKTSRRIPIGHRA